MHQTEVMWKWYGILALSPQLFLPLQDPEGAPPLKPYALHKSKAAGSLLLHLPGCPAASG